jgi:xylulokinase
MTYYLSIDLGTMGIKTCLTNGNGKIISKYSYEYEIISKETGQAEQNSEEWWKGFILSVKHLHETSKEKFEQIKAISICGQMHTHVYLDKDNKPLSNAITWLDQRGASIIEEWKENSIYDQLFDLTYNFPTTSYTAQNVLRIKREYPEIYKNTKKILIAKDYIKYLLSGEMVTDPSDASGTLLYDVEKLEWSDEAFKLLEIDKNLFPDVMDSTEIMGRVTAEAAKITGIKEGTPIINGGSDHSVAELGSGLFEGGSASVIVGTAGVVATCSDFPKKDPKKRVICWAYPLKGKWDFLGITQTAASSLTWFRNTFDSEADGDIFREYSRIAARVPAGSDGIIFLPYLLGERTPFWDSNARGVYFGLGMNHTKAHMIRALMEGVVYSLKSCLDVFSDLGVTIKDIRTLGGGSRSDVWRQIEASVFNSEISTLSSDEPSAIGNMILSMLGTGEIHSAEEARKLIRTGETTSPVEKAKRTYESGYEKYLTLYERIKDLY